jgi:hypothetical protein
MYTPLAPPSDPKALSAFLNGELQRIAQALNQRQDRLQLRELHAEPSKPRDGDVIYADGTDYDPGLGEGPYCYIGGLWVRMSAALAGESVSAAKTFDMEDANKAFLHPSADTTARTWTIPANASVAYPLFTALTFINQNGAGVISIAITSDTMRLAGAGSTGTRSLAANGIATAIKVTATEWLISGTGLT